MTDRDELEWRLEMGGRIQDLAAALNMRAPEGLIARIANAEADVRKVRDGQRWLWRIVIGIVSGLLPYLRLADFGKDVIR